MFADVLGALGVAALEGLKQAGAENDGAAVVGEEPEIVLFDGAGVADADERVNPGEPEAGEGVGRMLGAQGGSWVGLVEGREDGARGGA